MGLEISAGLEAMLRGARIAALIGEDLASNLGVRVGDAIVVQSRACSAGTEPAQWDFEVAGVYPSACPQVSRSSALSQGVNGNPLSQ